MVTGESLLSLLKTCSVGDILEEDSPWKCITSHRHHEINITTCSGKWLHHLVQIEPQYIQWNRGSFPFVLLWLYHGVFINCPSTYHYHSRLLLRHSDKGEISRLSNFKKKERKKRQNRTVCRHYRCHYYDSKDGEVIKHPWKVWMKI